MSIADASAHTLGDIDSLASLVSILVGCVLLHVRLRNRASLSLLISVVAAGLWFSAGQSMVYKLLAPPYIRSPPTEGLGNSAQAAFHAMSAAAPAENAMIVGGALFLLWTALSFVFAVASIRPCMNSPTNLEGHSPR